MATADGSRSHALVLELMGTVPLGKWGATGGILSVKDLLRAQTVLQPVFSLPVVSDESVKHRALETWAQISMYSLKMYTGNGRRWALDTKTLKVVRLHGVPLFVGRFTGPIKPDTLN